MTVLNWVHTNREIPDAGLSVERSATADERVALAKALDVLAVESLTVRYKIKALAGQRYQAEGEIRAALSQACVVTLEPVACRLSEQFDVEYVPPGEAPQEPDELSSDEPADGPHTEAIVNGEIRVGQTVLEELLSAIDPYPKAAGAAFDWSDPKSADGGLSPFAKLAQLKPRKTE